MLRGNQIRALLVELRDFLRRRPLVGPALILILAVNLFVAFKPWVESSRSISCIGVVRHIEYSLDGTVEIEIRTRDYGRLLYKTTTEEDLMLGDNVRIEGLLKIYKPPTNPGEFDYISYLRRKGITGVLYPDSINIVSRGSFITEISSDIQKFFYHVREFALSSFDDSDKAMAAALFMGDTSLVDESVTRAFRLSDCSHLLAVSGTHYAGFLMIITEIISRFHIKRKKAAPFYMSFCILIGAFTGWSESVTRASVMSICSFMSRDYASGMALATILLIVKDPYSCLSTGFLMSFAASLSIRLLGDRISTMLAKLSFPEVLSNVLTPVMAATVGMMPFWSRTCYYFSFVHLATQITASMLATIACVFFIPCVVTGLPFACSFIFKLLSVITKLCSGVSMEGADTNGLSPMFIYSAFLLMVLLLMPNSIVRRYLMVPCIGALMISVGLMAGVYLTRPEVRIIFIDVGQGDSCLIMSEGKSLIIDGGVEDEGRYSVSSVLDYYGIGSVDMAVASHMDEDHIGGLNYLDQAGRIDTFLTCYDLSSGDEIRMTDDITLYCVWPCEVTDGGNEDSVVLRLVYGDLSILYTGDIGFSSEAALIETGAEIDSDILKVGHHGSAYSTSSEFLEYVTPDIAVISVEENSRYGHPAPATLERLTSYGCEIRRTDLEGAIIYELP